MIYKGCGPGIASPRGRAGPSVKKQKGAPRPMHPFLQRVQRRILAGLVLIVPIVVTAMVATFLFRTIDRFIGPLVDRLLALLLGEPAPGEWTLLRDTMRPMMTVLMTLLVLYFAGFVSTTLVTRKLYDLGEQILLRIPLIKSVYGLTKQIVDLVMNRDKRAFKQIVMIEYPRVGVHALAFVTGETFLLHDPRRYVNLFLPTTPNPTSGFMLILPDEQVRTLDITIEDGIKMIMSGGVITPDQLSHRPYEPLSEPDRVLTQEAAP